MLAAVPPTAPPPPHPHPPPPLTPTYPSPFSGQSMGIKLLDLSSKDMRAQHRDWWVWWEAGSPDSYSFRLKVNSYV